MCQGAAMSRIIPRPDEGMQPFPGPGGKQLTRDHQVNAAPRDREEHAHHALQQKPKGKTDGKNRGPGARMTLIFFETSQEGPHGQRDAKGQHHIGNQNPREQPQTNASGHAEARIKAGPLAKSPHSERCGQPAEPNAGERDGDAQPPSRARRRACTTPPSANTREAIFLDKRRRPVARLPSYQR